MERPAAFPDDLRLARDCARHPRVEEAWAALAREHAARLVAQAAALGCSHPEDEVHDFLLDLWLPGPSGRCLLATYGGRAPLGPWLALVLRRRLAAASSARARARALHRERDPAEELSLIHI